MKITKQAQLGILIVFSLSVLVWGISYLKGTDIFKQYATYQVFYDRIDGLEESNNVTLNGYKIGKVNEVGFAPDNSGRLVVSFSAAKSLKIPDNSVAHIVSSDIMGTKSIEILWGKSGTFYKSGDTIKGSIDRGLKDQVVNQVVPLKNKAEDLIVKVDSVMTALALVLDEKTRNNLSESFSNMNLAVRNIEALSADLQEIMESEKESIKQTVSNINEITSVFSENKEELSATLSNLSAFSDTLANISVSPVLGNVTDASEEILELLKKLNDDDNSAGLLFNEDDFYVSVKNLADNLSFLTEDIRKHPKRYLQISAFDFGKEVYINTKDDNSYRGITFKVHIVSSTEKLEADELENIDNIEEFFHDGTYSYFTKTFNKYSDIEPVYDSVRKRFPGAAIVAFKNGKSIKLEKALKKMK